MDQPGTLSIPNVLKTKYFDETSHLSAETSLPTMWHRVSLKDLCEDTATINPEKDLDKSFLYIDVSSVSNQTFNITETKRLLGKDAPSRAKKQVQANDVIFATVRPTLKRIAMVSPELDAQVCSTGFCVLRADKRYIEPAFLYFHLLTNAVFQYVSSLEKGAIYPAINDNDLLNYSMSFPPLPEQHAIAHILQTAQNAIQARRRELELERERKASLMQHLFTHGTRGEATKQTEIGKIPESWAILAIGDIATLQRGFDITRREQKPGNIPVISSSGTLSYHDTAMVKGPGVIIGRKGSLGTAFYVEGDYWPHDTTLWVKDFHQNSSKFIYYFLRNLKIGHLDVGSSNPTLNRNHVHSIMAAIPELSEQYEIAEILSLCDSKITTLEKEITLQEELFRALLEELMTGRLSALPLVEP